MKRIYLVVAMLTASIVASSASAAVPAGFNGRYGVSVNGFVFLDCPAYVEAGLAHAAVHKNVSPPRSTYLTVSHGALEGHALVGESFANVKFVIPFPGGGATYSITFTDPGPHATLNGVAHVLWHVGHPVCTTHGTLAFQGSKGRVMLKP